MRLFRAVVAVVFLACAFGITIPVRATDSFSFITFDVPGARQTYPFGINAAGQIIGGFFDEGGKTHGFLRTAAGHFTVIDVPGASGTVASGIDDIGRIVGWFDDATGKTHGFSAPPPVASRPSTCRGQA